MRCLYVRTPSSGIHLVFNETQGQPKMDFGATFTLGVLHLCHQRRSGSVKLLRRECVRAYSSWYLSLFTLRASITFRGTCTN